MKYGEAFNPFGQFIGFWIPNSVAMSNMSDTSKLLLGRLFQFAGKDGKAYPTRKTLANALNWSIPKLDRNIRSLKDLQLIETYQKDEQAPSTYIFLYNQIYEFEGVVKSDSSPTVKSDSSPTIKSDRHKRIKKQESNLCFSKEKRSCKQDRPKNFNSLYCSICNQKQFETRSGATCINGHGGVEGIKKKKIDFKKLKKIIIEKEKSNPFNYSNQTIQILNHWQSCGGKIYKNTNAKKGPALIDLNIEELLMPGRNPFISVINDDLYNLRTKAWTVDEIVSCIDQYVKVKHKPINKMHFNEFITFRYNGFKMRNLPDYSPLAESFQELDIVNTSDSKWFVNIKTQFTKLYPDISIYDTVYLNVADFLYTQSQVYEMTSNGIGYNYSFVKLFVAYIKEKVNEKGSTDLIQYMSGKEFLTKFIQEKKKTFMLERKNLAN